SGRRRRWPIGPGLRDRRRRAPCPPDRSPGRLAGRKRTGHRIVGDDSRDRRAATPLEEQTMADRILIKNAIVLSQDPAIGGLPEADVVIDGDRIAEVRPNLSADGAQVIDATGDIVIPGFIDTHRHTWETSIRTSAPDYALITYFGSILDKFAPHYRPDDVYAGNLWGALECINAGITTLVDWSHIINTPDHADAG